MMDGTFVEELAKRLRRPRKETIHGREYLALPAADGGWSLAALQYPAALPAPLNVATLTGLVDYLKESAGHRDDLTTKDVLIHVADHRRVDVVGIIDEQYSDFAQRPTYLVAEFAPLFGEHFKFGTYYDAETFNVALQSLFLETPERAAILQCVGTIKESAVRQTADDGTTQTVTASSGVVLVAETQVPNPVILQPFRTFRELVQPASKFILRLRGGKDTEKPSCALFEADGGAWKREAIGAIAEYLKQALPDYAVVA